MELVEDFFLLATQEEDGRPLVANLRLGCGLAAAALLELAGAGQIELGGDPVVVHDPAPLGVPEEDATSLAPPPRRHTICGGGYGPRAGTYQRTLARLVASGAGYRTA